MATIKQFININIQKITKAGQESFLKTPLIYVGNAPLLKSASKDIAVVKTYSNLEEVQTDYGVESEVYKVSKSYLPALSKIKIGRGEDVNHEQNLLEILDLDSKFYTLNIGLKSLKTDDIILSFAKVIEKYDDKLFFVSLDNAEVLDENNKDCIASKLKNLNYEQTLIAFHHQLHNVIEASIVIDYFHLYRGSYTLELKTFTGVEGSILKGSDKQALKNKNVCYYENFGEESLLQNTKMINGEWFDIVAGIQALKDDMSFRVFQLFKRNNKLTYDEDGQTLVLNEINSSLEYHTRKGIDLIMPDFIVSKRFSEFNVRDKAKREFNNVGFTAKVKGAIHSIVINGQVTN